MSKRIAIVHFAPRHDVFAEDVSREISRGLNSDAVDIHNILHVESRLTMYEYLIILADSVKPWSSKISPQLKQKISQLGLLSGKRCAALLLRPGIWKISALLNFMRILEAEGMIVNYSQHITNLAHARAVGAMLPIDHA